MVGEVGWSVTNNKEYQKNYRAEHRAELLERHRNYQKQLSPEKIKEYNIKSRYGGLALTQYKELIASGCAICGTMESLCLDHDHRCCPGRRSCGKCIRGCLCARHNRGEGYFKTVEELLTMAAYLMQFENVLDMA